MLRFVGLESTLFPGIEGALPKPALGVSAAHVAESLWYHMRGFGSVSDKWPRADQIMKTYTSEAAPAFRPPPTPLELPLATVPA